MSDWLDEVQKRKEFELLEEEREWQRGEDEFWNSPAGVGLKKHRLKITSVYQRLADEIARAIKVGGFYIGVVESGLGEIPSAAYRFEAKCGSPDKDHWYGDLRCEAGPLHPLRILNLRVSGDIFRIEFIWHTRPYTHGWGGFYHDRHNEEVSIARVDDAYVSYLIKWLATGSPEFQSARAGSAQPKGFLQKLFG